MKPASNWYNLADQINRYMFRPIYQDRPDLFMPDDVSPSCHKQKARSIAPRFDDLLLPLSDVGDHLLHLFYKGIGIIPANDSPHFLSFRV